MTIAFRTQDLDALPLRPYLGRLWCAYRGQRRLRRALSLVPLMLARLPALSDVPPPREWVVQRAQWTRTGVAVIAVGSQPDRLHALMKLSPDLNCIRALRAEARTLRDLHASLVVGQWRDIIPRIFAEGDLGSFHYTIQQAMPGTDAQPVAADQRSQASFLFLAEAAIRPLHALNATTVKADRPFLSTAVDEPIETLGRLPAAGTRVQRDAALGRLRAELRSELLGRTITLGCIHGDFWSGNLLVDAQSSRVTGIVDWCMAGKQDLAGHDLLHVILYGRQIALGCELGDVVRAALVDAKWEPHERALLEGDGACVANTGVGLRPMILLYWLRRLKRILDQDLGHARHRLWLTWNVEGVLRWL